jgi:hypothetical protein
LKDRRRAVAVLHIDRVHRFEHDDVPDDDAAHPRLLLLVELLAPGAQNALPHRLEPWSSAGREFLQRGIGLILSSAGRASARVRAKRFSIRRCDEGAASDDGEPAERAP